ncbi:MAG: TIGR03435 family protein [Acidobacteriota bacterium]
MRCARVIVSLTTISFFAPGVWGCQTTEKQFEVASVKSAAPQANMQTLANFLKLAVMFATGGGNASMLSARVVDKTGLSGEYDVKLEYDLVVQRNPTDPGEVAPTLFAALQQQLGLKLEQTKQQLDVLVIDRAEKTPTEN